MGYSKFFSNKARAIIFYVYSLHNSGSLGLQFD